MVVRLAQDVGIHQPGRIESPTHRPEQLKLAAGSHEWQILILQLTNPVLGTDRAAGLDRALDRALAASAAPVEPHAAADPLGTSSPPVKLHD